MFARKATHCLALSESPKITPEFRAKRRKCHPCPIFPPMVHWYWQNMAQCVARRVETRDNTGGEAYEEADRKSADGRAAGGDDAAGSRHGGYAIIHGDEFSCLE